jgi:hypothetical protein
MKSRSVIIGYFARPFVQISLQVAEFFGTGILRAMFIPNSLGSKHDFTVMLASTRDRPISLIIGIICKKCYITQSEALDSVLLLYLERQVYVISGSVTHQFKVTIWRHKADRPVCIKFSKSHTLMKRNIINDYTSSAIEHYYSLS